MTSIWTCRDHRDRLADHTLLGGSMTVCRICHLRDRLDHYESLARRIPGLRAELARLEAEAAEGRAA